MEANPQDSDDLAEQQRQRRMIRVLIEGSRMRQRFAQGGAFVMALCLYGAGQAAHAAPTLAIVLRCLAPIVLVATAIPFWRTRCPRCRKRYHGVLGILGSPENPPP